MSIVDPCRKSCAMNWLNLTSFRLLLMCVFPWDIMIFQVIIGSPDLKANHSINQVVEVVTDIEKYNRFVPPLVVDRNQYFCLPN